MAKKIVRGITDVKTINNQDFDTNNVNDLLSDGQYNYIHRKKGENEEYHNLTDNIKTLFSDNTELLSVTNNNKTTNTATLHPKHDAQKEQVLESTRDTIAINHGTNGTAEKTTVDTNPQKVLEHENLISDSEYITLDHETDVNKTHIKTESLKQELQQLHETKQDVLVAGDGLSIDSNNITIKPKRAEDLTAKNGLYFGNVVLKDNSEYAAISLSTDNNKYVQIAFRESLGTPNLIVMRYRFVNNGVATDWKQATIDNEELLALLSKKQDKLTAGEGITIQGNTISASGGGATHTIQDFSGSTFSAWKHVVVIGDSVSGYQVLTTFVFECYEAETVLTGELKEQLERYVVSPLSKSNGAITIKNDGTNMKLINSKPTLGENQQATFTFHEFITDGGGGELPPV